ncbi:hypothetical protein PYCCODRAFT_1401521 [Trametes coccinea BRFM310]|uniref:Potassium channel domain-containing protein n=1 Tax=Trametes coccinea (strain BRFM310) TaxID=1353009 RepID=A0A1Y2J5V1_TRAC3|nr:hypothetical protein PYCCODRAFT_1401521 [Trametes coccinea BRFM310]
MGLFGAPLLLFPILLSRRKTRHPYDPEKADVPEDDNDIARSSSQGDRYNQAPAQGILSANTPYRGVRRIYHHEGTHTSGQPVDGSGSSDDLTIANGSWYSRIKSYIWPTDMKNNDIDQITPNYRWTPILTGIVIPFSILLEIPGLTERWYIRTENHTTVETRKNPVILEVGMAISIACALIANIALVLRFLEKRVQTVTLVCIVSLTIHDLINIVAVTVFGVEHRFDDGFTYGEAFWMTLCSTIASTVSNISLIVDFIRTPDFSRRGSGLTRKQRSLMIVFIVLLVYIAFGALINSILLHLSFINGLYFSVVSIETIGFGDIVPHSTGARVWTCFYILFGVINVGVVIAMFRETALEAMEVEYRRRMRKLRQTRRDARRFRRWEARWQRAVEFRLRDAGLPIWVSDKEESRGGRRGLRFLDVVPDVSRRVPFLKRVGTTIKRTATLNSVETRLTGHHGMHLNVNALSNAQLEEAALEAGVPLDMFLDLGERRKEGRAHKHGTESPPPADHEEQIAPALSRAHAAHAFRDNIVSGWPSHPQTPTHAQLGRMAAMVTKFAVAVAGRHAHAPQLLPDAINEEERDPERERASGNSSPGSPQSPRSSSEERPADDPGNGRAEGQDATAKVDVEINPAANWLKEFSRGPSQISAWTYENFVNEMEAEETKAYYVKLSIAFILFSLFWTVGSGIFSATEGWPYGSAMYFCFCAFVTTGYGDFAPVTPAGRSVFVVWSLLGVGTLTIVVSVLQEASSSRYKSALHSRVFDKAVKKYRKRHLQDPKQRPRPALNQSSQRSPSQRSQSRKDGPSDGHERTKSSGSANDASQGKPLEERLKETEELAQRALEALPGEIVRGARTFQEYMQYFVSSGSDIVYDENEEDAEGVTKVPPDMKKLLDELAEMEHINERVKSEILQDEDARKTLFMLSLERSLKKMVASAEKALSALADRDALATITSAQQQASQQSATPKQSPLSEKTDENRSGSESPPSMPRTQSEPTPRLHRRVRHAPHRPHHRRGIEHAESPSSSSDTEDDPSSRSSVAAGPS